MSLLPTKEQNAALEAERVAFEAALLQAHPGAATTIFRISNGSYGNPYVRSRWEGWQDARAQSAAPAGVSFDLAEFAKLADIEMRKHDFHGFEPVVFAVVEQLLAAPSPTPTSGVYGTDPLACPGCVSGCFRCSSPASADHVEDARQMVSDVVPVPREWIAVQDGLPNIGDKCLIKIPVSKHFEVEGAEYKGDGDWLGAWCSRRGRNQTYKVSHWVLASDLLNGGH